MRPLNQPTVARSRPNFCARISVDPALVRPVYSSEGSLRGMGGQKRERRIRKIPSTAAKSGVCSDYALDVSGEDRLGPRSSPTGATRSSRWPRSPCLGNCFAASSTGSPGCAAAATHELRGGPASARYRAAAVDVPRGRRKAQIGVPEGPHSVAGKKSGKPSLTKPRFKGHVRVLWCRRAVHLGNVGSSVSPTVVSLPCRSCT